MKPGDLVQRHWGSAAHGIARKQHNGEKNTTNNKKTLTTFLKDKKP